jgi:tetratricopeptide (TPR) repeat protein
MAKISRNAPCPCGSGKKYKKCCLSTQPKGIVNPLFKSQQGFFYDDIDILSNKVLDLINQGKFDEAESGCNELLSQYPDQIDGLDRMAHLFEMKGDKEKAAEYYHKAANFALKMPGYDQESIDWFLSKAAEMESE